MARWYRTAAGILAPAVVVFGLHSFAPSRLTVLKLAGRASVCPLSNAVAADANRRDQLQLQKDIAESRVRRQDPAGYAFVDTGRSQWWIPAGARAQLFDALAGQMREIYGTAEQAPQNGEIALDCGAGPGVWPAWRWATAPNRWWHTRVSMRDPEIIETELMEISAIADDTIKFERIIAWCASRPDEVPFALHQLMGRRGKHPSPLSKSKTET